MTYDAVRSDSLAELHIEESNLRHVVTHNQLDLIIPLALSHQHTTQLDRGEAIIDLVGMARDLTVTQAKQTLDLSLHVRPTSVVAVAYQCVVLNIGMRDSLVVTDPSMHRLVLIKQRIVQTKRQSHSHTAYRLAP